MNEQQPSENHPSLNRMEHEIEQAEARTADLNRQRVAALDALIEEVKILRVLCAQQRQEIDILKAEKLLDAAARLPQEHFGLVKPTPATDASEPGSGVQGSDQPLTGNDTGSGSAHPGA